MGSPTVFSKLEVTSVVVVAIVAGMVIGGLAGTPRRVARVPLGYTIASRGTGDSRRRRTAPSNTDRASGAAFAGWAGAGLDGAFHGSGQWVSLSAAATYQAGAFPHSPPHIPSQPPPYTLPQNLQHTMLPTTMLPTTMLPTTMLPLAALPSAGSPPPQAPQSPGFTPQAPQSPGQQAPGFPPQAPQPPGQRAPGFPAQAPQPPGQQAPGFPPQAPQPPVQQAPGFPPQAQQSPVSLVAPQSPVALVAPQSPAFLLVAPQSPATPLVAQQSGGSSFVELQPVAFLPGIYQAATYRLDVTGRADTDPEGQNRPLWRLGNALFSAARGKTVRAITPPAGSPPSTAARPGRHRASQSKRVRRNDKWMRDQ